MGDEQDFELKYLGEARTHLRLAREALAQVGRGRQRRGAGSDDMVNVDDELRELDAGLLRAEQRRKRDLTIVASQGRPW